MEIWQGLESVGRARVNTGLWQERGFHPKLRTRLWARFIKLGNEDEIAATLFGKTADQRGANLAARRKDYARMLWNRKGL